MISGTDRRRKLSTTDAHMIMLQDIQGMTIRAIASEHGISTKYVKKLLTNGPDAQVLWNLEPDYFTLYPDACSGCGRNFNWSGLQAHFFTFTSGGIHTLDCQTFMPGIGR